MLRLNDLSIGTKLIVTAALGITLMAGVITTVMLGNAGVRGAVDDANAQSSLSLSASESRASIRGMEIGLRDMRLSLNLEDAQKAMGFFHERQKSANDAFDYLIPNLKVAENRARMQKVALQKCVAQPLDLIISDFNMPELDGLGLLRAVRGHPAVRKLPFILITGRGDRELVVTAAQAGVNNYLVKPFTEAILRQKMEEVMGKLS